MLKELSNFILAYRGDKCFIGLNEPSLRNYILDHVREDRILYQQDSNGSITGVIIWCYEEYFPLKVKIEQLLTIKKGIMAILITNMFSMLPYNFRLVANRKRDTKFIEYPMNKRNKYLKLLQKV